VARWVVKCGDNTVRTDNLYWTVRRLLDEHSRDDIEIWEEEFRLWRYKVVHIDGRRLVIKNELLNKYVVVYPSGVHEYL